MTFSDPPNHSDILSYHNHQHYRPNQKKIFVTCTLIIIIRVKDISITTLRMRVSYIFVQAEINYVVHNKANA